MWFYERGKGCGVGGSRKSLGEGLENVRENGNEIILYVSYLFLSRLRRFVVMNVSLGWRKG